MAQETLLAPTPSQIRSNSIISHISHGDDPIVPILERFSSLPADCLEQLFSDFETASRDRNLRGLLDAISDWAATAEVYAHPTLGAELREAINGHEGIADWLPG